MASSGCWLRQLCLAGAVAAAVACRPAPVTKAPAAPCYAGIPGVATLRGLEFDPVFGAADTQYADFARHVLGQGKLASIEPQTDAWVRQVRDSLKAGRSCVIARIGTQQAVPGSPFFGASRIYWVVEGNPDDSMAPSRSIFVPDSAAIGQRDTVPHVTFRAHPAVRGHYGWKQAIARFKSGSLLGWSVCADMCCESALQ